MKTLGIITARANSKRLPGKNMHDLGGTPLIGWSIRVGLKACDSVVVSTDDPVIAQYAEQLGATVINRPANLCLDDTPSAPVVLHAASRYTGFDAACLLQPTSPFRTLDDVVACKQMFSPGSNVISVVRFAKEDWLFSLGHASRMRRLSPGATIYTENGAIYLLDMANLLAGDDWYANAYGYVMPADRSLDIDTHTDMDAARAQLAVANASRT